ncbi:hypothetical protein H0Z60_01490 [Ectothiorhodospiraceae bacterium WFHF3C12]|nr:hypothetical protein [Ectothiorhodospiraceae bacterium WFHF3C12]
MSEHDRFEQARDEALEAIRQEGERVAIETRVEIQEKTRQWVTASAAFLVLAFSLLAFFGYKETADFRRKLTDLETEAQQSLEEARAQAQSEVEALRERIEALGAEVDDRARAATRQITEARDALAAAQDDFDERLDQLDAAGARLTETQDLLRKARTLEATYREAQQDVQRQLRQIAKLQNSFFDVFVMYQAPASAVEEVVDPLLAAVRDAGFVVEPENIMRLSVDRTEIIYYDPGRPPQVDTLLELLRDSPAGRTLSARGEPVAAVSKGRRNPRDLLIKIRAQ